MTRFTTSLTALIALTALVFATAAGASSPSAFKLTTKSGKKGSFVWTGYEWLTSKGAPSLKPAGRKPGKLDIDLKIASSGEKALLKQGALKTASLHVLATLPKPQNVTYTLSNPKIVTAEFVNGNLGEVAAVTLSYTSEKS